ncbi:M3 family oligoendopeptidase [Thermicanus aegyptius]|uniref:M3 family oligoendopeptidase n=1 Tax=Thermicanus aegyptius TaxID=94009 RepID=UPI0003F4F661|nr:M3 family oligoendopeptidase [Thermicanus aegyptius]
MLQGLSLTWDLEKIFPGGSQSEELNRFMEDLKQRLDALQQEISSGRAPQTLEEAKNWAKVIDNIEELSGHLAEVGAFLSCLTAQNVKDEKAKLLYGRIQQYFADFTSTLTSLDEQILKIPDEVWNQLLREEFLREISFPLEERREKAKVRMDPVLERLATDLSVDGYHAWGEYYNTVVGRITIPFEIDGEKKELSVGQANNLLDHEDRNVRRALFSKYEEAWADAAELTSGVLNHLGGFRLALYKNRGWDSVLKEPLEYNRMTEETLEAMWATVEKNKEILVRYLERKARLLGLDRLSWFDVDAPLRKSAAKISYDEGAHFIVEQFRRFNPKMADFAAHAFTNRWIEAEDRPGKRPGGFCTNFPLTKESRIFMTYSGTMKNVSTLAHELGHAYHQSVMNDLPYLAQDYAMNVAETASTFAEMIVSDAALKKASSKEEKIALLDDKLSRAIAFFMNLHARFLFELDFYTERKKGPVSVDRLNELMAAAQKRAYKESLQQYHPYFWESKLHFYITEVPFYNFPYTFGFLFSSGIYARALAEGPAFAPRYEALLGDTGRMKVEDLAKKHLGEDLTKSDFWQSAVDLTLADAKEFLKLTE